jgi:fructokinase
MSSSAVGIGEVLWDLLPDGPRLGGAPCNVLVHLRRLGHEAVFVSAVGDDDLGAAARGDLEALGLDTRFVAVAPAPTGRADVELDEDGVARFTILPGAAYEWVDLTDDDVARIARTEPVALAYGTLAQRSDTVRRSTRRLAEASPGALRLYDVNLRSGLWDGELVADLAAMATVVKMNDEEAAMLAPLLAVPWPGTERFCRALSDRFGLRGVAVTAGASGAVLLLDGDYVESRASTVVVVDTIGAGDGFAAALVDGILAGLSPDGIVRRSVSLGALIASKPGATPDWDAAELEALESRLEGAVDL